MSVVWYLEASESAMNLTCRDALLIVCCMYRQQEAKVGVSIPKFLRTHPVSADRVENIKALAPKALKMYREESCRGRNADKS